MTIEEFNNTSFGANMEIAYKGNIYDMVSVDFEEALIGYDMGDDSDNDVCWARCENVRIIK